MGSDGISPFSQNGGLADPTLPRAMMGSGIPHTVIETENAMFDNYMRRLNEVWMRRTEVCVLPSTPEKKIARDEE